ncbi:MAG: hypothetical protein HWD59_09560 [Coxiellaceae bacterium]|nr:MAG: hypothetical protein HWD59_09560 [Coxiellaceae bacterium]
MANIIMIWIGDSKVSPDYSKFIIDQIERYGMQHRCKLIEPIFNLEEVYKFADLFFFLHA